MKWQSREFYIQQTLHLFGWAVFGLLFAVVHMDLWTAALVAVFTYLVVRTVVRFLLGMKP